MVKRRKAVKKEKPNYAFIFFTVLIFVGAAAAYAFLSGGSIGSKTKSPSQENVHRHATLKIEGVDVKTLLTAERLRIEHPPLHLHDSDVSKQILHMEGPPTPLISFFNSIGFDVSNYEVYANGNKVDFSYIFSDGDEIELRKR